MTRLCSSNVLTALAGLLLVSFAGACSNDDPATAPAAVAPTGSLMGRVMVFDNDGVFRPSGTEVRLEGTGRRAFADDLGRWRIDSVRAGVYNVIVSRPGFTTDYLFRYQFVGTDTAYVQPTAGDDSFRLFELPEHRITSLDVDFNDTAVGESRLEVSAQTTSTTAGRTVLFVVSDSADVSLADLADLNAGRVRTTTYGTTEADGSARAWIVGRALGGTLFPGRRFTVVAYPVGTARSAEYYDPIAGKRYYPSIVDAPSPAVSVVIP